MALEISGVNLRAEGFQQYIAQLKKIDAEQRKVFDTQFQGTDKSYKQIVQSAKQYEAQLKREVAAQEKAAKAAVRAADQKVKSEERAAKAAIRAADQEAKAQAVAAQQRLKQNALIAAGVLFAAKQVFDFGKESLNLYRESARAEGQVAAAIASTGGAAGQSVSGLKAHASALQDLTNFDDEATLAAQAMLLTFTKIGKDIFPQATEATLDLATAMGGDTKGAALQLGKALNDPVAGMNALRRSGVQFSEDQQKAIKALVETGQIAKAQAIILAEVNKEFGGSAEAAREADGGYTALANSFGNMREQLGGLIDDLNKAAKVTDGLQAAADNLGDWFQSVRVHVFGGGTLQDQIENARKEIEKLQETKSFQENTAILNLFPTGGIDQQIADTEEKLKGLLATEKEQESQAKGVKTVNEELADSFIDEGAAIDAANKAQEERNRALQAQQQIVRQAEQIQKSYTRAVEDAADKQAKAQAKLGEQQTKARDDLLKRQTKEFDKFQADAIKETQKLETDRGKEETKLRTQAAKQEIDDQRKLQQQLKAAEEQYNLSRFQSKRRNQLQDRRLQAEGDILGLQQLREDFALQQQEEKESFNLSQSQTKDSAAQQTTDQAAALDEQLRELQTSFEEQRTELTTGLEERRAELLASFDEEFTSLQLSQQEQRDELKRSYEEQLEDLRQNRERQIEDLGASFVEQEALTKDGAQKIADALEEAFGVEGVADTIMAGFAERQASSFQKLFEDIGAGIKEVGTATDSATPTGPTDISRRYPGRQLQSFDDGGVVAGPIGSPQIIQAHGGEMVMNQGQQMQVARMLAPVVQSQNLNVRMSGGFNVSSSGGALPAGGGDALKAEIITEVREAMKRVGRSRN